MRASQQNPEQFHCPTLLVRGAPCGALILFFLIDQLLLLGLFARRGR